MTDNTKAAVTVAEMARMVGLGRSRFYQLIGTTFPFPVYSVSTRRPFYPEEMQRICLEVKRRNCGIDGKPILFYAKPVNRSQMPKTKKAAPKSNHSELLEGLKSLGLVVTSAQVDAAISEVYPTGIQHIGCGEIVRNVFIHLKKKGA